MPTSTHPDTRIDSIDERQKKRSVKFTFRFAKTVQNVGSRERMLGLEVGPARPSLFLVEFSLRVRVLEAHAAALFGAARS